MIMVSGRIRRRTSHVGINGLRGSPALALLRLFSGIFLLLHMFDLEGKFGWRLRRFNIDLASSLFPSVKTSRSSAAAAAADAAAATTDCAAQFIFLPGRSVFGAAGAAGCFVSWECGFATVVVCSASAATSGPTSPAVVGAIHIFDHSAAFVASFGVSRSAPSSVIIGAAVHLVTLSSHCSVSASASASCPAAAAAAAGGAAHVISATASSPAAAAAVVFKAIGFASFVTATFTACLSGYGSAAAVVAFAFGHFRRLQWEVDTITQRGGCHRHGPIMVCRYPVERCVLQQSLVDIIITIIVVVVVDGSAGSDIW